MHVTTLKKNILKRLHDVFSYYMTIWKRQNYGNSKKKISGCQEF